MAYIPDDFTTDAVINNTTLFQNYDEEINKLIEDAGDYLVSQSEKMYSDLGTIVTDGIVNDEEQGSLTTYSSNKIEEIKSGLETNISDSVIGIGSDITLKTNTSIPLSTQLAGTFSLSNTVKTLGFGAFTYTGNGTSQTIVTGVSTIDFTQANNGTGFYHDRVAGTGIVKNDAGTIVESGSIAFKDVAGVDGICKIHIKGRSVGHSNTITDGLRGYNKNVYTDSTSIEGGTEQRVTGFTSNGFTLGTDAVTNQNTTTYISYIELYTHIKWGLTSQGKRCIEAYNPVTNMGMIVYQGSGVAGHEIPHSVGVELDYADCRELTGVNNWYTYNSVSGGTKNMYTNLTNAEITSAIWNSKNISSADIALGSTAETNGAIKVYVLYYKAKSKIWTIVPYTGTGVAGNFVETKDSDGIARRPSRVIIKAASGTAGWYVSDNARGSLKYLMLDSSSAEGTTTEPIYNNNGFTVSSASSAFNQAGVQYIALVEFDTDGTGTGDSYFDSPTDTTQLQLTDGIISISNGYTSNGADNKIITKSGTIQPIGGFIG